MGALGTGRVWSWLWVCIAVGACLVALAVGPEAANAATWMSDYPVGTVHLRPSVVAVDVFGAPDLAASTARITIDGVAQATFLSSGEASGHWASTESLVGGTYTITWRWVADSGGVTKATFVCYPAGLGDGAHNVNVSASPAGGGAALTHAWSFTLAEAPVFGTVLPQGGATVYTLAPQIGVGVDDNSGSFTATATVNGNAATVSVDGGQVSLGGYTLTDGTTTVTVTARDGSGNVASKTWSFFVSVTRDQACASCHEGFAEDNAMGPRCTACHTETAYTPPHGLSPAHDNGILAFHTPGCTCHAQAKDDPTLAAAIAAGHGRGGAICIDCHADRGSRLDVSGAHVSAAETGTVPMHVGRALPVDCSTCHSPSLMSVHDSDCVGCHASADTRVKAAIAAWNGTCEQCHPSYHNAAAAAHQALYNFYDQTTCARCHVSNVPEIVKCLGCHSSSIGQDPSKPPFWRTTGGTLRLHQSFNEAPGSFPVVSVAQSFTVPSAVTTLFVDAYGAPGSQGGMPPNEAPGAPGGRVQAEVPVTPLSALTINVGTPAVRPHDLFRWSAIWAGWPNGGTGQGASASPYTDGTNGAGSGGGSTSVVSGSNVLAEAGGGGGGGGGLAGTAGTAGGSIGSGVGGVRTGGTGSYSIPYGGGGGGGWNGGAGGASGRGGLGGTSYVPSGVATYTVGVQRPIIPDKSWLSAYPLDISWTDGFAPQTVSDAAGTYIGAASIALTASDTGGSGVACTRYRLDGGPETTGNMVSAPADRILHTLVYYSVDNAGNTEAKQFITFTTLP